MKENCSICEFGDGCWDSEGPDYLCDAFEALSIDAQKYLKKKKDLISLDEHNTRKMGAHLDPLMPVHNGIACPECGDELYDTNNSVVLTSCPPKYRIHCDCGYRGYRN